MKTWEMGLETIGEITYISLSINTSCGDYAIFRNIKE